MDFKSHSEYGENMLYQCLIWNFICIIENVQLMMFILYRFVQIPDKDIYLFQNYLFGL